VTLTYLLDTNVMSAMTLQPDRRLRAKFQQYQARIGIASVVWHELWFGIERLPLSRRRTAIERYLAGIVADEIPILDYTQLAAEWHARERARLAARGQTPPFIDGQIAAIAAVNDLTLVTFNLADFRRFEGLRVVDWH
jgi:tRNA(fMet)-specific endonuclease VapC